jgi:UDP-N-acetylglucosamine--N-acetylmuramyl-(pentapeptide) pyrophosphoryl-undecaprenol N-acetylglucosamine transferase
MKVVVTGGGTGGHIYPAVAIAQSVLNASEDSDVLYIGMPEGLEQRIVPGFGIPMDSVEAAGLQRRRPDKSLKLMHTLRRGYRQALKIMDRFRPQVVVGTGGYVCVPVILAARKRRIPALLHEQNAYPGLANRILSLSAAKVMLTFPEAIRYFPRPARGKMVWTGMPVRQEILAATREAGLKALDLDPNRLTVLATGGSQGAQSLNRAMVHVIKQRAEDSRVQIIHVTGHVDFEKVMVLLKEGGISPDERANIIVKPYLEHMEYALACADLCVTRAGAAFLSEMTSKGAPGILIPYPYATGDHQTYNAKSLEKAGAAVILTDQSLTGPRLLAQIEGLLFNEERRALMSENSRKAGKDDALRNILKLMEMVGANPGK